MEKPNYYSIIPAKIRYDEELTANAKLLYGEITALCNEKGICWASNEYFARLYGTSKSTISRLIRQLSQKEYIFIKMFYKKDSKEIEKRIISINKNYDIDPIRKNDNTYTQKCEGNDVCAKMSVGYTQNYTDPIRKNDKENITSINNKEEEERDFQNELKETINFYENNITLITPFVAEDMEKYLKDGLYSKLIIEVMKEAVSRNARSWKYIASTLNDCLNNKVYTAQQFKIKQEEFKSNKQNQNNNLNKKQTKEKIEYEEVTFENEEEYKKKLLGRE